MTKIQNVPTNIITGFLGVGKTTAILQLLKTKPDNERWAVLVNEFGQIGLDASLISGQSEQSDGLFIAEVPGGCMCCASGVPMQIALNALLTKAKPDRLLIEPTGLGHPKEVLKVLSGENYQSVLQLNATLTLVDARNLSDARYTTNDNFNQQLEVADIVIGNKTDLYGANDRQVLTDYLLNAEKTANKPLFFVADGQLEPQWLQQSASIATTKTHQHQHQHNGQIADEPPIFPYGYLQTQNSDNEFNSIGWRFCPKLRFDREKISAFLSGLEVERVKAVIKTARGTFGYNKTSDPLAEIALADSVESRIEIIAGQIDKQWVKAILACVLNQADGFTVKSAK